MFGFLSRQRPAYVQELEERIGILESEVKRIRLEWNDTYDRMAKMSDRFRKRAERTEAASNENTEMAKNSPTVAVEEIGLWRQARNAGLVK